MSTPMSHTDRMRAIRRHVDTIIAQTEALERLGTAGSVTVSFHTSDPGSCVVGREHALVVPVDELRALIRKRIDDADAAIRSLGMVAPRPAPDSIERMREEIKRQEADKPAQKITFPEGAIPMNAVETRESRLDAELRHADLGDPGS